MKSEGYNLGGFSDSVVYIQNEFPVLSQTFVSSEAHGLHERGAAVGVVSCHAPESSNASDLYSVILASNSMWQVLRSHAVMMIRQPRAYARYLREVSRRPRSTFPWSLYVPYLVTAHQIDRARHIHTHFATRAAALAGLVSDMYGIPRSVTTHAADIYQRNASLKAQLRGARVLTVTRYNQKFLESIGFPDVEVVRCGVDTYSPAETNRSDAEIDELLGARTADSQLVLSVGRLVEKKGHKNLILAVAQISTPQIRPTVAIVGDGPLASELEARARDVGVDLRLLGAQPNHVVRGLLRRADVFALACVRAAGGDADGLPVAILEAAVEGCPIVAGDVTGVSEFVDDSTGWLVDASDVVDLSSAIQEALNDPVRAGAQAEAARARALGEFSLDSQIDSIARVVGVKSE